MSAVRRVATAQLPARDGGFTIHVYDDNGKEHVALTLGALDQPATVRIHSECLTGDVFGSSRCDCGEQLTASVRYLQKVGSGVLLYLRQEGRGIGLANKIRAYALQDDGLDTVDANLALGLPEDARDYGVAAHMLLDLGIRSIRLLTNNPDKIAGLRLNGVDVVERLPMEFTPNAANLPYLRTKHDRMGHLLSTL